MTLEGSDADLCEQIARRNAGDLRTLAVDKGYDKKILRKRLRELEIRPLIKHRIFAPYDHAHNARIDDGLYAQRSMTETVNSAVKRSLGFQAGVLVRSASKNGTFEQFVTSTWSSSNMVPLTSKSSAQFSLNL